MPLRDDLILRDTVARHDEQIKDHDRLLIAMEAHLAAIAEAFRSFQTKVLIVAAVFLAGTPQGQDLLHLVTGT